MLVRNVVRKNLRQSLTLTLFKASLTVHRSTRRRFTMGSVKAESHAATTAATAPCAAAPITFVRKEGPAVPSSAAAATTSVSPGGPPVMPEEIDCGKIKF